MPSTRAEDRAAPAGQRRAADDDHGDDLELVAGSAVRIGRRGADRADDPGEGRHHRGQDEQRHLDPVDVDAARPRGDRIAAGRLDPVAVFRLRQHVAENDRRGGEPEERGVDPERPDIEIADQEVGEPLPAGAPGALGKAVSDEQRRPAHDEQHAEGDEEGGDLEPRDEEAVDEADQRRDDKADREGDGERGQAAVVERPHQDGREAEQRADREVEFAGRHQEGHGERDEPELDGESQRVGDVEDRQELGIDRSRRPRARPRAARTGRIRGPRTPAGRRESFRKTSWLSDSSERDKGSTF